jgi:transposase
MESTGVHWRSIYCGLHRVAELWLVNAAHVKRMPGRKTDVSDAEWLADVAAHGMVRPSYVPPPPIRELRELTRYRKTQVDARTREIQAVGEGVAGRRDQAELGGVRDVIEVGAGDTMIAGERDPIVLADMAKSRMRTEKEALTPAWWGTSPSITGSRPAR